MNDRLFAIRLAECMAPLCCEKRVHVALRCLDAFVGANFAGVFEEKASSELIGMGPLSELNSFAFQALSFNCNSPFVGVRVIEYLYLAKEILADKFTSDRTTEFSRFDWLFSRFRCHRVWLTILAERSAELKEELYKLMERLDAILDSDGDKISWTTRFQFELEKSAVRSEFFEHSEARKALEAAARLVDLRVELSGALGRRTRFQERSLPQLIVSINSNQTMNGFTVEKENIDVDLPTDCRNNDDTLLQRVRLDDDDNRLSNLTEWESLYLLQCGLEKCHASTNLDVETSLAFIEQVINCRRNWAVQIRALIERSVLERKNKRRVERACSQIELICRLLDGDEGAAAENRLRLIYTTSPVPFWRAQCIHAKILSSLGCVAEALSVYERLEMWDEVVACYRRLGQLEKAENVVRGLLARSPNNPIYHCIMGDITNQHEHYLQAIEISNNKCARAHTSLGMLYLSRRVYAEAFQHFKSSVEIQPYQVGVCYNLGCCAMNLMRFPEAAKAFHRCVMYEPEHFEAWNNLAACYVHLGQKERAQKIVQESIKLKHDSIKVWENLVIMSVSIDDLQTALLAVKNVMRMDTKRKLEDFPLEVIAAKTLRMTAKKTEGASALCEQLVEVLACLMARQSLSAKLLRSYAELKRPPADSNDPIAWSKHVQLLEKTAQKESTDNAEKTEENYAKQLENAMELLDAMANIWRINALGDNQKKAQMKLRLRPLLSAVEKLVGEQCENSQNERLKAAYEKASALLL